MPWPEIDVDTAVSLLGDHLCYGIPAARGYRRADTSPLMRPFPLAPAYGLTGPVAVVGASLGTKTRYGPADSSNW
jgi:hypothetical protein